MLPFEFAIALVTAFAPIPLHTYTSYVCSSYNACVYVYESQGGPAVAC